MTRDPFSETTTTPMPTETAIKHASVQPAALPPSGYRVTKWVGIGLVCLASLCVPNQSPAQSLSTTYGNVTSRYQLNGTALQFEFHDANSRGGGNNSGEIDVSELDLDAASVGEIAALPGVFEANLACKQQTACIQMRHSGGMHWDDQSAGSIISQPYLDLTCNSQRECVDFLNALKNALTPRSANRPPAAPAQQLNEPSHGAETVIDGSHIPSQIDFTRKQPGAPTGSQAATDKPAFEPFASLFATGNSGSAMAVPSGTDALESLFDVESTPEQTLSPDTAEIEKFAAGLFDEAREGKLESAADVLKYEAEELLTDAYKEVVQNTVSYSLTGKSFDELPQDFQKDYAVWDAGLKRILEPFSLKGGLELVDAFGDLFDLSGEQ